VTKSYVRYPPIADTRRGSRYGWRVRDELRNPFGGFLFSGPDDALSCLAKAAEACGLTLLPVDLGDDVTRLCLPAEQCFGDAGMALVNRAQDGEFGNVSSGLFGGTIQKPH